MNRNVLYFVAFVAGAAAGTLATWQFAKKKYEQIAQEEIASVKETFAKREKARRDISENKPEPEPKLTIKDVFESKPTLEEQRQAYKQLLNDTNYISPEVKRQPTMPYVISPEDFGELDDFERFTLTYYKDGVLVDEVGDVIHDWLDLVSPDYFDHFGEFEDDAVYVRNPKLKCDYEILYDERNYEDISP